jgi:hypothetical protein
LKGTVEIESFWTGWERDQRGLFENASRWMVEVRAFPGLKSETWGTHFRID